MSRGVVKKWTTYFNKGDVFSLVNLYSNDAILVPSLSYDTCYDRAQMTNYFFNLRGGLVKVNEMNKYDNILTGNYTLHYMGKSRNSKFKIILEKENKIIYHYTSLIK